MLRNQLLMVFSVFVRNTTSVPARVQALIIYNGVGKYSALETSGTRIHSDISLLTVISSK